jgi:phosphopantothenoylcysteine decarboxylase/phosphopantothenate--cysteine ligase
MEDLKVEKIADTLSKYSIALGVTGGIAAIETPKIARHLRRYGATVTAYVTPTALNFIGKASLEWATERSVVCELTGLAEHIAREDLVLVVPTTLNTFNKIMYGIADNNLTSLVASALGQKKPVFLAPTMHESLYNNPFFQENLARAGEYGVTVIPPRFSEGKAKIPKTRDIVDLVINHFMEDQKYE